MLDGFWYRLDDDSLGIAIYGRAKAGDRVRIYDGPSYQEVTVGRVVGRYSRCGNPMTIATARGKG